MKNNWANRAQKAMIETDIDIKIEKIDERMQKIFKPNLLNKMIDTGISKIEQIITMEKELIDLENGKKNSKNPASEAKIRFKKKGLKIM
eukprot:gene11068-3774_t